MFEEQDHGLSLLQMRAVDAGKPDLGDKDCKCTGMKGAKETTFPEGEKQDGTPVHYDDDAGSTCAAWDNESDPVCKEKDAPKWCKQKWCFVDPCSCSITPEPKQSAYFPDARKNGRPVYYSYATCGGKDEFTADNHDVACPNQEDEDACGEAEGCAWTGDKCVGKDLVDDC